MKSPIKTIFLILVLNLFEGSGENSDFLKYFKRVDTCDCGRHDELAARIVGGEEAEPNQYPWMVAIFSQGKIHCGGSLINDRYVLTAGHCLNWSKKKDLTLVFGLHNRRLRESQNVGGISAEIEDLIVHEDFSSHHFHDSDDIGLIKLREIIKFSPQISPICLPKNGEDYSNQRTVVLGWGRTSRTGNPSELLMKANVTVMSNGECRKILAIGQHILDSMMCAYEHKIDACQGDSGGPLIHETDRGEMEQIGIVSWGIGCAEPGMPGIYTRITSYLEWIARHTLDATYCRNSV